MNELVSVIMGVYREKEEWLRESIESILGQTYRNLELIIILDDPGNQKAKNIIEQYRNIDNRIRFSVNEQNMGLPRTLNRAIFMAKGKYIARMDADDISLQQRIETQYNILKNKKVDFVTAAVDFIDGKGNIFQGEKTPEFSNDELLKLMKYGNLSIHPSWFLKKQVYDDLNGYREIDTCEDYDFVLRALQKGILVYRMKEHVLLYRLNDTGISKTGAYKQFLISEYLRNLYKDGKNLENINLKYIGNRADEIKIQDQKNFLYATKKMDEFCKHMIDKNYIKCAENFIINYTKNSMYRKLFSRNLRYRIEYIKLWTAKNKS